MDRQKATLELLQKELDQRKSRNPRYSMRAFAKAIGISQSQLSLILSGIRKVTFTQSVKIAKALAKDLETYAKILDLPLTNLPRTRDSH